MKISSGNLISSQVIKDMLKHVPMSDLKRLKEIKLMLRPPKSEKQRYGLGDYNYGTKVARVFLWSIRDEIKRKLLSDNNYYHVFLNQIALTLFHEIGHHKHYIQGNGKKLSERYDELQKKEKDDSHNAVNPKASNEMWDIHIEMEKYADDYMNEKIKLYHPIRPSFKKIRFIRIFREKWVDFWMSELRKHNKFCYQVMRVVEHLRKCQLSKDPLYSASEIFENIRISHYFNTKLRQKYLGKARRIFLKLETPLLYVSKQGKKYPYFTEKQAERLSENNAVKEIMVEHKTVCEKMEKVESLKRELNWARKELEEVS